MPTRTIEPQLVAWQKVCALVSGAALGPTVEVLEQSGALGRLVGSSSGESLRSLVDSSGLHFGYAHVAMQLLATQGLLEIEIEGGAAENLHVRLSPTGFAWARQSHLYDGFSDGIAEARDLRQAILQERAFDPLAAIEEIGLQGSPDDSLSNRIAFHLEGPMIASIWGGLGRRGILTAMFQARLGWVGVEDLGPPGSVREFVLGNLLGLGWILRDEDLVVLSPEGRGAARWAPLFNYVFGYLSVYERAAKLLRRLPDEGDCDPERESMERELLLAGKSHVFRTGLQEPLTECLEEIFHSNLPAAIVDMNAGDGNLLSVVHELLRSRGEEASVSLVGLVRNPLAAAKCRETLVARGIAAHVLEVDFSEPDRVDVEMRAVGLQLRQSLVLSKTTIHDRKYRGVGGCLLPPVTGRPSEAVFVSPEGDWIPPQLMEDDLAAFFARWRAFLRDWGIVAIDTHAVPPQAAASSWSENVVTHVAASHGYSSQYLIECDRFREAARRAGFVNRFSRDLGSDRVEAVTMSLDYFVRD